MLDYLVNNLGYLGIIGFLTLCGCGVPVPEEAPIVLAGWLSSEGTLDTWLAFSACLCGALLGDSLMYCIGRTLGHGWLTRHPSVQRFIDAEKEQKLEHAVQRHGFKVLLLTRFLVGVRGPVYYAAGATKVPYLRFLLWDLISATLVVSVVFGLGYKFGKPIIETIRNAEEALTIGVVMVLAAVGVYFLYKKQTERMADALDDIAEHDAEEATHKEAPVTADPLAADPLAADALASDAVAEPVAAPSANGHAPANGSSNGSPRDAAGEPASKS